MGRPISAVEAIWNQYPGYLDRGVCVFEVTFPLSEPHSESPNMFREHFELSLPLSPSHSVLNLNLTRQKGNADSRFNESVAQEGQSSVLNEAKLGNDRELFDNSCKQPLHPN